jgi:hypothetical protein
LTEAICFIETQSPVCCNGATPSWSVFGKSGVGRQRFWRLPRVAMSGGRHHSLGYYRADVSEFQALTLDTPRMIM